MFKQTKSSREGGDEMKPCRMGLIALGLVMVFDMLYLAGAFIFCGLQHPVFHRPLDYFSGGGGIVLAGYLIPAWENHRERSKQPLVTQLKL